MSLAHRLVSGGVANNNDNNNNDDDQQMIEILPELQQIREVFKKLSYKLLRSPSGAPSNIGLDIFPEEEAEQEKIDQDIRLAEVPDQQQQYEEDDLLYTNNNNNNNNSDSENQNDADTSSFPHSDVIHDAYLTASSSFCPQIRCFAVESMKHCLKTGDARVADHDGAVTAASSGQEANPWNIHEHVPQEEGRLLVVGPPSVGKTRFALQTTNAQPFLGRPAVYLPLDYLFSTETTRVRTIEEALRTFMSENHVSQTKIEQVMNAICATDRSFPIVWIFDNLEILANRNPDALKKIDYGGQDPDVATNERDGYIFFSRDGLQRDAFFKYIDVKKVSEWRMLNWNALEERAFIWTACGEHHPYVSSITSTVLRAFEMHPQLARLRGSPTTTHLLTLLAMRGSNLTHVKCLSEAFELLIHLTVANQKEVKTALGKISKAARELIHSELTYLTFDGSEYANEKWFHNLVASGFIAVVGGRSKIDDDDDGEENYFSDDLYYDNNNNEDDKDHNNNDNNTTLFSTENCSKVAFRNRYVAELFAHMVLFQSEDEGKSPKTWSWLELKWNRGDRVLWTLVAGRVASRNAQGNPRELFAFHAAAQFFLYYNRYRSTNGTAVVHDPEHAATNRNKTLCYLFVELAQSLGATIMLEELLDQHGYYHRPPSHLRWMIPLCGRFGAIETLKFLHEKLKSRSNPQPFTMSEMIELYTEAVLSGQRPAFFGAISHLIEVSFDLRQSAQFGTLSPLLYSIDEARRLRQATSPAFLKRVFVCLREAEQRGDTDIMGALLNALPAADSLVKQLYEAGDAALACMGARKKLWIHYAQLWHAHPTMPWESVGCFSTDALVIQSFDEAKFREALSEASNNNNDGANGGSMNKAASTNSFSDYSSNSPTGDKPSLLSSLLSADEAAYFPSDDSQHQSSSTPLSSFTHLKETFTRRCTPNTAHHFFLESKITLIEGAPLVGKTTFGLQLCMIQPFSDHVCVYFDLRSLVLLTTEHRQRQQKLHEKQQQQEEAQNGGGGGSRDKKDGTSKITSFGFGKKTENNNTGNNNNGATNEDKSPFPSLPNNLTDFWKAMGLPIDERAPILWIFDNCGRLPKEVDNCVSNLLTEIASSSGNSSTSDLPQTQQHNSGSGTFAPAPAASSAIQKIQNQADAASAASPRSKDRAVLLSRVLRSGARYLAKDIINSHMSTWIMPPRSTDQENVVVANYLKRAANLTLHFAQQQEQDQHQNIHDHLNGASMLDNDEDTNNNHYNNNHYNNSGVNQQEAMLDLNHADKKEQIMTALQESRCNRQAQIQKYFDEKNNNKVDEKEAKKNNADENKNTPAAAAATTTTPPLIAPFYMNNSKGNGMVLKWICRLTAIQGQVPTALDPLSIIEQEMRRRCNSVGISEEKEQTTLLQLTCVAALQSSIAGFPFAVQKDTSNKYFPEHITTDEITKMLMCDFVHAAPDLKRQEYEFRASEVELFAALALKISVKKSKRFLPLLQWRGEFEAIWAVASASLSPEEFAEVAVDCLNQTLPSATCGTKAPPPFLPFFLLLEICDAQPSLVQRALDIAKNLRQSGLDKKLGLPALCGLFGSLNVLQEHLSISKQTRGYAAFDQERLDAVVSAATYFSRESFVDLVQMLNKLESSSVSPLSQRNAELLMKQVSSLNLMNESFSPQVLKKQLESGSNNAATNGENSNTKQKQQILMMSESAASLNATANNTKSNNTAAASPTKNNTSSSFNNNNNNTTSAAADTTAAEKEEKKPRNKNNNEDPLLALRNRDTVLIKHPNGFFASATDKVFRIINEFDPAAAKDVPFLIWFDIEDKEKKKKSKTKLYGIKSIKKDESNPLMFHLDLPERELKLEAKYENIFKTWFECLSDLCANQG